MTQTLATLRPSQPRRLMGVGTLSLLGLLLVNVGLATMSAQPLWLVALAAMGALSLLAAWRLYSATATVLTLTEEALHDQEGRVLARIDDVVSVDRGMFALRPSNGFVLSLSRSQPRAFAPGLWWRLGRRVGVGGVVSGAQSRAMADIISALIAERSRPA